MRRGYSRAFALTLVMALLAACGGGGSGYTQPPPPSATLSYAQGTQAFAVGLAITPVKPTVTGTLNSFAAVPALPAGLNLDPATGIISGTPTVITPPAQYTINANGGAGGATASAAISIKITDIPPPLISYGTMKLSYTAGLASSTLTPKTSGAGGTIVSWSINPALPAGLNFSTTDGSISGTPAAPAGSADYAVTAQNSGGQSNDTLTIEVDPLPQFNMGHQTDITDLRMSATRVFSVDSGGFWILWDYAGASVVAKGKSGCQNGVNCALPAIDMGGTTAGIVTPTGFELRATTDGHLLGTISAAGVSWWKVATDGSYVAAGSTGGLSVWAPSGQLLFAHSGDYSKALVFATPGGVLVGGGPAGSVIETIAVPSGTATTSPQYNGQFASWFTDGGRFLTIVGSTAFVYSNTGVQVGSITSVSGPTIVGQGNWVWSYPNVGAALNIYPATGASSTPSTTYTFTGLAQPYASGPMLAVLTEGSSAISLIDLSGSTPTKTDYASVVAPIPIGSGSLNDKPFFALSASRWVLSDGYGAIVDGATLPGTRRELGFGYTRSIAGGTATGHFAIATASAGILYFNSATLAQEGTISFLAKKLVISADGTLLVALGAGDASGNYPVNVYSLPAGSLLYSWPYTFNFDASNGIHSGTLPEDIILSDSGALLGQVFFTANGAASGYAQQVSAPTGGSPVFSSTVTFLNLPDPPPPIRISPDDTLIAYSQVSSNPGTNIVRNGTLVTAVSGLLVGWLDNNRLVVNNYGRDRSYPVYTGCAIFGADGAATGGPCKIPYEVSSFTPIAPDSIYVAQKNQILSVGGGMVTWTSGDPQAAVWTGAVVGSRVVFVSGTDLVVQSH